jgi:serine/threonine protein kinase/tetratricopeptide (TPR) repeat protein
MTDLNGGNRESPLDKALHEFVDARLRGEQPDMEEFVKQYPRLEHQIREKIRSLRRINALFDSLIQADESDFGETASSRSLVGQKVGSFEIVEMIGRGGMGVVYLARDTRLGRLVAIKSMPAELQSNSTARARFTREAELLASLSHPNIAVIYDIVEQDEGSAYLILEYIPGETLAQRIAREPLKLQEALSIGEQVAEAVSAAHEKGVVHRDLKPGNIKITPDNRVKVLDFGLAKICMGEGKNGETTVTQAGRVIGTPAYMSPEQARGKAVDHRTDIWSFGCVLYEMLTGHLPFEGETATDTLACIIEREPDWDALPERTPTSIRVLLRRCIEKDPNRRLRDLGDAAIEISETRGKPLAAQPMTIPLKSRRMVIFISATIVIALSGLVMRFAFREPTRPPSQQIRLVVLPFDNLGPAEDEYFAAGITYALTARLAVIQGLSVISRRSAMQYKDSEKNTQEIAKELGVDYILEGTVQRERPSDPTSRVRIIPQLIRASDDMHVWARTYDDDISEVFQMQSNLAERVARALDITLLESERLALASKPTENVEAYEFYLRGNQYFDQSDHENYIRIALQMYEKAVELDPTFALGHARLSEAHVLMYWFHYDRSKERLALAKGAADRAFQLDPELPEVHAAWGWYYYHGLLDFDRALEHFVIARSRQPNNTELLEGIACIRRRQGRLREALANFEKALSLDPLRGMLHTGAAETLMLLRKYSEAEAYYDRAILLTPEWPTPHAGKASILLLREGSTEKARAALKDALPRIGSAEDPYFVRLSVLVDVFDARHQEALSQLSTGTSEILESQFFFVPKAQLCAWINGLMGNRQVEQTHYRSAQSILESKIQEDPNDARFHSSLGIVYAGLGRKEDAIREGRHAVDLSPIQTDAWIASWRMEELARIYAIVGQYDLAMEQLEYLLSTPSELSTHLLRLDPDWAPLREHPRFKKLVGTTE